MAIPVQPHPQFSALFDALQASPDPILVTDRRNRIVFWNKAAEHLLGYRPDEVLGYACSARLQGSDLFGNRYCSDHCPITEMAVRSETVRHFNLRMHGKNRKEVTVNVAILNIPLPPPEQFYLVHVLKPTPASLEEGEPPPPRPPISLVKEDLDVRVQRLTHREVEVLKLLAGGFATGDIAERLNISPVTARNHIQNIFEKIEVHSKAEAVAFAFQRKLV